MSDRVVMAMAEGIARSNGWNGEPDTLPLHLPMSVLAQLRDADPNNPLVTQAMEMAQDRGYRKPGVTWSHNDNRILSDVVLPKRRFTKHVKYEEGEEEEFKPQSMQREGDDGESDEGEDGGGGDGNDGKGGKFTSKGMTREEEEEEKSGGGGAGEGEQPAPPQELSKEMQKWVKQQERKRKAEAKAKAQAQAGANSGGRYGGTGGVSAPDAKLASRMRATLEKIVGSFDMLPTPLWDGRKLVKRMLAHQTLDSARKWQDGRPTIAFLTDTSGSCNEMSDAITRVSTSATLMGVPGADIYAIPMSNSTLESDQIVYHNGRMICLYGGEEYNRMRENAGRRAEYLRTNGFGSVSDLHTGYTITSMHALTKLVGKPLRPDTKVPNDVMFGPAYCKPSALENNPELWHDVREMAEMAMRPLVIDDPDALAQHKERIASKLDALHEKGATDYGRRQASAFMGGREAVTGLRLGVLAALDADILIYYTDCDGVEAILSILTMLKPHQHLYVLTYANYPNIYRPEEKGLPFVMRANNSLGYHNVRGSYGSPAKRESWQDRVTGRYERGEGLTVPTLALSPRHAGDRGFIPPFWNSSAWRLLNTHHKTNQLTVFPGIDSMTGALWAMDMIASPDRLFQAKAAANGMRSLLVQHNNWNHVPTGWDDRAQGMYQT